MSGYGDEGFEGVLPDVDSPPAKRPQRKAYPCLRVLDDGGEDRADTCSQPSTYYATGNEARHGHLCGDCWQAQDESEQALYAFVALPGAS